MPKITIVGAGSFFTNEWIRDVLLAPGLDEGTFALIDIDEDRLNLAHEMAEKVVEETGEGWEVESSTKRRRLLPGSDYVINTIEVSGVDTVKYDYEIPKEYGVDQCIGDTTGPGGIMKAMRTVPSWLEILEDAERLCPDALVLNYTNPMHMMTLAADKASDMSVIGLCHSVQGTSRDLADYLDVPYEELEWECGGINHMAWFTKLAHDGEDLYPRLKERARDPEIYERDPIRFEMMLHFGYFVTESSGHFSEYIPYFRKRDDLIDEYCGEAYRGERGFYARNWPKWRDAIDEYRKKWVEGEEIGDEFLEKFPMEEIDLAERSNEYGSYVIEAHSKGKPIVIHGNVPNEGLIDNLPEDGIVEVPVVVDRSGFHPCKFGELPEQLAALNRSNMAVHKLAVDSILEEDKEAAIRAFMLDPLTAAVCSPAEIRNMAEELFEAESGYVPDYLTG
ncbi:glycoside hydrolase family 4 [candidate division MSBL1 archaeon SCGC-AAA259O05]|uniref:Glycoside hydrolase family 4 n=1 Tax=candidate division MSBL1 archaeon SCGC-AAA259O05 TaxID=1698271 RepID=A0A133UXT1_9EURY|nr:glycoside hydrolase family 4 [candidate division MSBL1 archaeon SCGC-AAA259O05]